jgi:5-formyltetrahydrofolate cyclo-ligase
MGQAGPGDSPELADAKRALRGRIGALTRQVQPVKAREVGVSISRSVAESEAFGSAGAIALFSSIQGEPDLQPLFEVARARDLRVALPRVDAAQGLCFHVVDSPALLRPGAYGVLEPPPELEELEPPQIDLALLPGVAFDLVGGRLGRGRAYYDRAFPIGAPAPLLVGVGFAFQLVDRVPLGEYDRLLDGVVTEQGLRWCTASDCES